MDEGQWLGWEEEIAPPPPDLAARLAAVQPPPAGGRGLAVPATEKIEKSTRAFIKSRIRAMTGQRMSNSWVDKPKVDLFAEINCSRVVAHREAQKKRTAGRPRLSMCISPMRS